MDEAEEDVISRLFALVTADLEDLHQLSVEGQAPALRLSRIHELTAISASYLNRINALISAISALSGGAE